MSIAAPKRNVAFFLRLAPLWQMRRSIAVARIRGQYLGWSGSGAACSWDASLSQSQGRLVTCQTSSGRRPDLRRCSRLTRLAMIPASRAWLSTRNHCELTEI